MEETTLKLILWITPWMLLISVLGYGYQSDGDFEHFMVGNMPTVLQELSEIRVSKNVFGLEKIDFRDKSITAQFYFHSPFPFPVKIKDVSVQGESQGKKGYTSFEMRLEKEVLIQPHENSTLILKGEVPSYLVSNLETARFKLEKIRMSMEILGMTVEIQKGGN